MANYGLLVIKFIHLLIKCVLRSNIFMSGIILGSEVTTVRGTDGLCSCGVKWVLTLWEPVWNTALALETLAESLQPLPPPWGSTRDTEQPGRLLQPLLMGSKGWSRRWCGAGMRGSPSDGSAPQGRDQEWHREKPKCRRCRGQGIPHTHTLLSSHLNNNNACSRRFSRKPRWGKLQLTERGPPGDGLQHPCFHQPGREGAWVLS